MNNKYAYPFRKKARAFTLPELVVSLLLMAILFVIGFTIYLIIGNHAKMMFRKNSFYFDYHITRTALQNDFSKPGTVLLSDDKSSIILEQEMPPPAAVERIEYTLDSAFLIRRTKTGSDTLMPGAVIEALEFAADSLPLVRYIKLRHSYNGKPFFTYLQKKYTAAEKLVYYNKITPLINHEPAY